jgi:thiamine biosynthesis lipoprotein
MTSPVLTEFRRDARLMGSAFEFIVLDEENKGESTIDACIAEVKRIEDLLTEFAPSSQTSQLNSNAGKNFVTVDQEVFDLIVRCKRISSLTQGASDITAGVLKRLYNFKGEDFRYPDEETISQTLQRVGSEKITTTAPDQVFLAKENMRINFAAVGKGYAADKVKAKMMAHGIESGVINASGDLTAWGRREDGTCWKVGIADPNDKSKMVMWIPVDNASVATSGDYEQYFERNGIRYSHTIDPKTGRPTTGIKSVTIVSPSAELSDALATAVFVMGVDAGMNFINQLPKVYAVVIDHRNKLFTSRHLNLNLNQ